MRLVVAAVLLVLLARRAGRTSATEASLFDLFNSLPSGFHSLFSALYRLGALWAVALVTVAALGARRWRLARDLSLAGLLAWAIARGLGVAVNDGIGHGLRAVLRFGTPPAFPLVRLAAIAAVLAAAAPYLTRPTRRVGGAFVVALAVAAMYLGTAFPNDLIGTLVLGWGVAAAIHLTLGSPGGRPTAPQIAASLAEVGLEVSHVRLAGQQPAGATVMVADDPVGELRIKLIGRDEADARLLANLWRFLYYKDSAPTLLHSRAQQLEHEASGALLACRRKSMLRDASGFSK